ncbi:hypothetical protein MNBD_GAMMA01-408 [hydrothermal vent metagenome]|uniref:Glycosyltransferase 2-like domain-containing protein n=1 Tax=hydrothermal vent metagenome TaxID=652676 RepID=A0A3B0W9A1_9ZZZZ
MTCSVIIVNYNTGNMLKTVVAAVLSNQGVDRIIVVDNNSTDNSMSLLGEDSKLLKYYRKTNHGFAASCNYGSQFTNSEYLLFLNPDCIITTNTISTLITSLQQHTKAAIIGCRVNNPNDSEQRACRRRLPTLWRTIKTFTKLERLAKHCHCFAGVNLNHLPMPQTTTKVEAISGACILIKSKVFKQIQGFDERFPLHFEDLDLFKRILNQGYEILFNPNITVIHHQGLSSQHNSRVPVLKKQGLIRYFQKHCSPSAYLTIKMIAKII